MFQRRSLILIGALTLLTVSAAAQNAPIIRQGVTEVSGFVGASYGIDQTRVMGGGNVVYSLTTNFMPFGEVSYFPGIGRTQSVVGIPGATESFSIPLTDFNFGFHIRVPIAKSRIIPYGVISVGGIHSPQRNVTATFPNPANPDQVITTQPFQVNSSTDFAVSGGAGLRYYTTERLGFRVEFKAYRPSGIYTNAFYRVAAGFFYQF
jgi:outer membrane protein with beta-barrel domain